MLSFMMLTTFKVWEKTIKNGRTEKRKRTSNIICTMLCLEFVTPGLSPEWGRPGDIFQKIIKLNKIKKLKKENLNLNFINFFTISKLILFATLIIEL